MLLAKESIFLDIALTEKKEVLSFIAMKAKKLGVTQDDQQVLRDFLLREEEYTTAVQQGIAIPHAKSIAVTEPKLIFVKLKEAIAWESDEFQVQVIFAILVPVENAGADYIKILSEIATNLLEEEFQTQIFAAQNEAEILTIITEYGKEKVE